MLGILYETYMSVTRMEQFSHVAKPAQDERPRWPSTWRARGRNAAAPVQRTQREGTR